VITPVKLGGLVQSRPPFLFFGLGSCFVQNLATPLDRINIPYQYNPLGTSFNPVSIAQQLEWLINQEICLNPSYLYQGVYHQLQAANNFQHTYESSLNKRTEDIRINTLDYLNSSKNPVLIISFGTAHCWEINETIVNNCHKLPNDLFERRLLGLSEIKKVWDSVLTHIPDDWQIIFTVSPVKYTKVGLEENFISKSILRLSIKSFVEQYSNCHYFPSYEIITDELRDYSYFKDNGTHPNEDAVEIVFERFKLFINL
jgi:hypothetical protein